MKQGHIAVVYLMIYLLCFMIVYTEQRRYDIVVKEKRQIEKWIKYALEEAAERFISSMYEPEEKKKEQLTEVFFEALYVYFGMQNAEDREKMKMHIPFIALIEEDGVSFYYAEKEDILNSKWNEKQFFSGRNKMEFLEQETGRIITEHNYIAQQYGLEYSFYVPDFFQTAERKEEYPIIVAVFQGWPLDAAGDVCFDTCMDAGISIRATEKYIIEVPDCLTQTKSYYHRPACNVAGQKGRIVENRYYSEAEAMRRFGALPCGQCTGQ